MENKLNIRDLTNNDSIAVMIKNNIKDVFQNVEIIDKKGNIIYISPIKINENDVKEEIIGRDAKIIALRKGLPIMVWDTIYNEKAEFRRGKKNLYGVLTLSKEYGTEMNKRGSERLQTDSKSKIIFSATGNEYPITIKDVSTNGLCIYSDEKIEKEADRDSVNIILPEYFTGEEIIIKGKIVRTQYEKKGLTLGCFSKEMEVPFEKYMARRLITKDTNISINNGK